MKRIMTLLFAVILMFSAVSRTEAASNSKWEQNINLINQATYFLTGNKGEKDILPIKYYNTHLWIYSSVYDSAKNMAEEAQAKLGRMNLSKVKTQEEYDELTAKVVLTVYYEKSVEMEQAKSWFGPGYTSFLYGVIFLSMIVLFLLGIVKKRKSLWIGAMVLLAVGLLIIVSPDTYKPVVERKANKEGNKLFYEMIDYY